MHRTRLRSPRKIVVAVISLSLVCLATHHVSAANVSGDWSSNLGSVSFRQSGNQVSGTLRYAMTHKRLEKYVKASLALSSRTVRGRSGRERAAIAAKLQELLDSKKMEDAKETLQTETLRRIVLTNPSRTNPSDAEILKEIRRHFDESQRNSKAMEVAEFNETKKMLDQHLADIEGVNVFRAQVGMQMLLPGSKEWKSTTSSRDPMGTLKLAVPENVVLLPIEDDEAEEYMLLPLADDVQPVEVTLVPLDDGVEPEETTLVQFSDVTEANKKSVQTWTTASVSADLSRWSEFVFTPRIDRVVPEAAAGNEPGATISLVGRYFSAERSQNTIQIMKTLADGSVGILADLKPSVASTAGTALEFALPGDLNALQLIVRVVVDTDGKSLTSNPVELSVNTPPSAAPTITGISPSPQSPSEMIAVDGRDFGDAALVELWFHPKTEHPLPRNAPVNRIAYAQVLSDTQLYSQVPVGLNAGDYLVACNRNGRLSNWFDFAVIQVSAD